MSVLAIDLGASSGKALVASLDSGKLRTTEVHRFENGMIPSGGRLTWDVDRLLREVRASVRAAREQGFRPSSLAIDGWAVDHVLLDQDGERLGPAYAYRDKVATSAVEAVHGRLGFEAIYGVAGIQCLPFNTIYQLAARSRDPGDAAALARARRIVMIPEYLTGVLAGRFVAEETNASSTSLLDARTRRFSEALCKAVPVSSGIFPEVVRAGTLLASRVEVEGLVLDIRVPACHDTACAVAATPLSPRGAYVSSGTWSLVGLELPAPVLTDEARRANVTNEAGVEGTTRFLKNVMGLWLLQECRREWQERGNDVSFSEIARLAFAHEGLVPLVFPDDARFLAPASMTGAIEAFCKETGQRPPESVAETARSIETSLALRCADVISELERLSGTTIETVHVVGGGSRDRLLCQLTADATGRTVVAGPAEATALGNALVQLAALGEVEGSKGGREVVARSFELERYEPRPGKAWKEQVSLWRRIAP